MLTIRPLQPNETDLVGDALGLARLNQGNGFYFVAWEGEEPAGHLHLACEGLDLPELQDVQVAEKHRRKGVATSLIAAAEEEAKNRGFRRMRVKVSAHSDGAQALYRSLGYIETGLEPIQVKGTIQIRTGPIEVDDTLLTWEKPLP